MTLSRRTVLSAAGFALAMSSASSVGTHSGRVVLYDATGAVAVGGHSFQGDELLRLDPLSVCGHTRLRQLLCSANGATVAALVSEAGALVVRTEVARARGRLVQTMRMPRGVVALVFIA